MPAVPPLLEQLINRTRELYSLPVVAVKVLELTNHPRVDAARLKACIENDPALTTKVLRVVNSSLFGLSREVSDLNQALALLGIKPLKLLVLGFSLPDALFTNLTGDLLSRYWKQTLTRAVAAREISERIWKIPGDEAFIAGLLRDLGMLALIQGLGQSYADVVRRVHAAGGDLLAVERGALGFDHRQLSAGLLSEWGLPPALVEAVAAGADDLAAAVPPKSRNLHAILELAEQLADLLVDERADRLNNVLALAEQSHQMSPEQIHDLVNTLSDKVQQLADVLSLELPAAIDYAAVLEAAHHQLVAVASETVADTLRTQQQALHSECQNLELLQEVETLTTAVAEHFARKDVGVATVTATPIAEAAASHGRPPRVVPLEPAITRDPWGAREPDHFISSPRRATAGLESIDPGFLGRVAAAAASCRQARCALSLLFVEVDHYEDHVFTRGLAGARQLADRLESLCRAIDHPGEICVSLDDGRFGLILPDCERRQAVEIANDLHRNLRDLPGMASRGVSGFSASIGAATVALPPKNFRAHGLVESAARCLAGAQLSGGDTLKSIEIY